MRVDPKTIESEVQYCEHCPLRERNYVAGLGYTQAPVLVLGASPGEIEDTTGVAFTGPTGELVRELLASLGVHEDHLYYTNVIKRRTKGKPSAEECHICGSHLAHEIVRNQPKVILALGSLPFQHLAGKSAPLHTMHGFALTLHKFGRDIILIPTYSPGYVTRQGGLTSTTGNEWMHDLEDFVRAVRKYL